MKYRLTNADSANYHGVDGANLYKWDTLVILKDEGEGTSIVAPFDPDKRPLAWCLLKELNELADKIDHLTKCVSPVNGLAATPVTAEKKASGQ